MIDNGFLRISPDELAAFVGVPQPSCWWINPSTGETSMTPGRYGEAEQPEGSTFLMAGPDPIWVFQWAGDWQRACDEQLNVLMSSAFPNEVTG